MRFKTERLLRKEAIRFYESGDSPNLSIEDILSNLIITYSELSRVQKDEAIEAMEELNQPSVGKTI